MLANKANNCIGYSLTYLVSILATGNLKLAIVAIFCQGQFQQYPGLHAG